MSDHLGDTPTPDHNPLSRREFLKAALTAGIALAAPDSKSHQKSPELAKTNFITPEYAGRQLWQAEINNQGQGLIGAIEAQTPLRAAKHPFAVSWFSADRQFAANFTGPKGNGVLALVNAGALFVSGQLNDFPQLAQYDPQAAKLGDRIVAGKTADVEGNFNALLEGQLSDVGRYLNVSHRYDDATGNFVLQIGAIRKLGPGDADYDPALKKWQAEPIATFTRPGTSASWVRG